jgi:single-strand DNA-binding protein
MNRSTITGRLTRDPELRSLPTGDVVCTIRLAVDDMAGRGETGYINAASFGKPGEAAARVLSKGWLVAIDGRLRYASWTTDDGQNRHDYELVGNIEFLAAPKANSTNANQAGEDQPTNQDNAA